MKRLSKTEKILNMLADGKSVKEIAKKIGTSENYVYYVRWNDKKKGKPAKKVAKTKAVKKAKKQSLMTLLGKGDKDDIFGNLLQQRAEDEAELVKQSEDLTQQIELPLDPLATQIGGSHYRFMEIQPIEYIMANDLSFLEGCIVKRISRWRVKGGLEDLEKIKHEVDLLINAEKKANPSFTVTR